MKEQIYNILILYLLYVVYSHIEDYINNIKYPREYLLLFKFKYNFCN